MNDFDNLFSSSSSSSSTAAAKPAADPHKFDDLGDIFGGSARFATKPQKPPRYGDSASSIDLDSMYGGGGIKNYSLPVFDKPLYDDDIFEGVPGLKSSASASAKFDDDVFSMPKDRSKKDDGVVDGFDDLLGGFGKKESEVGSSKGSGNVTKGKKSSLDFDDLLPGFGGSSPSLDRSKSEATRQEEPVGNVPKASPNAMEDPFSVFDADKPAVNSSGLSTDPSEGKSKSSNSQSTMFDDFSSSSKRVHDDMDPFDDLGKSLPTFSSEDNNRGKDRGTYRTDSGRSGFQAYAEPSEKQSVRSPDSFSKKSMYVDNDLESHQTLFDMPPVSTGSSKPVGQTFSPPSASATSNGSNVQTDMSPGSEDKESADEIWLTVSEIPLYTQPTSAPPPSRPPPPIPVKRKVNVPSSKSNTSFQSPRSATSAARSSVASVDELEEFARGKSQSAGDDFANGFSADDGEMNSAAAASAAAMKEAMDRAEAKFRHAREARERDNTWAFRSKDSVQVERDENQERLDREQLQREREEEKRRQEEREREERENELRRLEKERERAREIERARARQAVERATREARERAAVEARLKAERAAAGKASAEARERAERAAVQRAQAEARARAAAGAKERAEKAAAEAREKERAAAEAKERERAAAEAREKAEGKVRADRAAVERAAAEARARAAAEARARAAAAAKANQQSNDNDLESFFSMGRASSAPRPRPNSSDPFDSQYQSKQKPEPTKTSSASSSTNIRKASSTTNIVDDLSSIFGAAPSSGDFQDIEGESEERRRARLERHQRTQERAAKALEEKNQRDLQVQREQAERHRIAETLDVEIRRWAAGKEGNLRALLSTMQYVLWPECGWQPVSLTDLITGAAVKKAYRKATLCIHPDKVQQKGANLQQKYIAEKVFDLLKEAWNKFNSEELF